MQALMLTSTKEGTSRLMEKCGRLKRVFSVYRKVRKKRHWICPSHKQSIITIRSVSMKHSEGYSYKSSRGGNQYVVTGMMNEHMASVGKRRPKASKPVNLSSHPGIQEREIEKAVMDPVYQDQLFNSTSDLTLTPAATPKNRHRMPIISCF